MFRVDLTPGAERDIARLDANVRQRVLKRLRWLGQNAEQARHERLKGSLKDLYKLHVGDQRVLYDLLPAEKLLRVHQVGHRREIYKEK